MPQFWLDANVLIQAHNGPYPITRAVTFWSRLAEMVEKGYAGCPRRVFKEVTEHEKHQDEVAEWMRVRREKGLCIYPTKEVEDRAGRIQHRLFLNSHLDNFEVWEFCKGGDPWVIAHASIQGGTVVTYESAERPNAKKPLVPNICREWEVKCVDTLRMFEILDIKF